MTEQESTPSMPATVVTTTEPLARPAPTASRAPRQWLAGIAIVLLIAACAGAYVYDNVRQQQQRELIHQLELRLAALQEQQPMLQENDHQRQQQILNLGSGQQQPRPRLDQPMSCRAAGRQLQGSAKAPACRSEVAAALLATTDVRLASRHCERSEAISS